MNVLHITLSFERGGRRRAIETLSNELRRLGARSDLACLNVLGCDPREPAESFDSIDVLGRRSLFDPRALHRLVRICRDRRIDVIHAHDAASQFTAAMARCQLPKTRLIMTFHRSRSFESARLRDRVRNAFSCAMSQAIITGSHERRDHFVDENYVPKHKVAVIPFGIDMPRFRPDQGARDTIRRDLSISDGTIVIGAVGHFGPEKGIDLVIQGYAKLLSRRSGRADTLVVVGDGLPEQRERMHALARTVRGGNIIFAGFQSNPHRWFGAFDIFAHMPRLEAFGLVTVEAMATRLPIVASRVGGIPEIIEHGTTGLLVPPQDTNQLADSLHRLIDDPQLREKLGTQAERAARQSYSPFDFAERHLQLYRRLLNGSYRSNGHE